MRLPWQYLRESRVERPRYKEELTGSGESRKLRDQVSKRTQTFCNKRRLLYNLHTEQLDKSSLITKVHVIRIYLLILLHSSFHMTLT